MGSITYNGVNSESVGIKVWTAPSYEIPERDVEIYHIPGRSGDLTVDYGSYKNVERSYTVSMGDESRDFSALARIIREWMGNPASYARLEDTYEPDCYRIALGATTQQINNVLGHAALAEITFNCKPQRFLKTGNTLITIATTSGSISNPTLYNAKPLLTIYGSNNATGTVTVNGYKVLISSLSAAGITVDCELQDCYSGSENKSSVVTLDSGFPILSPGANTIQRTGSVTKVEVVPRWWIV